MVAILDTWEQPIYLRRIWTVYEQFLGWCIGALFLIFAPEIAIYLLTSTYFWIRWLKRQLGLLLQPCRFLWSSLCQKSPLASCVSRSTVARAASKTWLRQWAASILQGRRPGKRRTRITWRTWSRRRLASGMLTSMWQGWWWVADLAKVTFFLWDYVC